MRLVIGADHAGFSLKEKLAASLREKGWDLLDVGTHAEDPADYPDFAEAIATAIREGRADRGILICGSGIGASVAANKIPGIRAGLCHDHYSAHQGVESAPVSATIIIQRTRASSMTT
jgi:RpiB/LacA/LacB family sugar-phosphate isomerase